VSAKRSRGIRCVSVMAYSPHSFACTLTGIASQVFHKVQTPAPPLLYILLLSCATLAHHLRTETQMPQFAANLGFLFQEVDLLERYNAAARVGVRGVETPFPYSILPKVLAARRQSCGLEQILCNLSPGDWAAGERGLGAVPGREEAFAESLE